MGARLADLRAWARQRSRLARLGKLMPRIWVRSYGKITGGFETCLRLVVGGPLSQSDTQLVDSVTVRVYQLLTSEHLTL